MPVDIVEKDLPYECILAIYGEVTDVVPLQRGRQPFFHAPGDIGRFHGTADSLWFWYEEIRYLPYRYDLYVTSFAVYL